VSLARSARTGNHQGRGAIGSLYAALAIALYYVGRTCRSSSAKPGWLGVVAYVGAAILVGLLIASVMPDTDAITNLLSLAIGAVVAPIVTIGLGVSLGRAAKIGGNGG
jgi:hypothetical protein